MDQHEATHRKIDLKYDTNEVIKPLESPRFNQKLFYECALEEMVVSRERAPSWPYSSHIQQAQVE